ncbi:MAG TPA: BolA family protein [Burkholderiales bacterium]|nr:BolA family protein [Burkholderiales bacterium]
MTVSARIQGKLAALEPIALEIHDDSAKHTGHEGAKSGGGHYRVVIVSRRFAGLSIQLRHRMVYDALGSMMQKEIHALAIKAYAPEEVHR